MTDDESRRAQRLRHTATMAGSLAPKGSYGLPSERQRAASRARWEALPRRTKAARIALVPLSLACMAAIVAGVATKHAALIAAGAIIVVVALAGAAALDARRQGRRAIRRGAG